MEGGWFANEARRIFGNAGHAARYRDGDAVVCKVGFRSWYGFHPRAVATTEQEALDTAARNRLPDDPSPANPSWVPGSYTSPFTPHSPVRA
jgi:hypothetical protein